MPRHSMFNMYHMVVFIVLSTLNFVKAALYVVSPAAGSTCHGGQPCTVTWLDNGEEPLLSSIGACTVGLYTGTDELLQQIEPVNVGSAHSLQFTPDPAVGPNGDDYYVRFASTSLTEDNSSTPYIQYSPNFRLDGMSGSSPTQIASLTSSLPVPSSVSSASPPSITSTTTIGTITVSTSRPSSSSTSTIPSSRSSSTSSSQSMSTSIRPSATNSTSPSSSSSTSAAPRTASPSMLYALALVVAFASVYMFC